MSSTSYFIKRSSGIEKQISCFVAQLRQLIQCCSALSCYHSGFFYLHSPLKLTTFDSYASIVQKACICVASVGEHSCKKQHPE